MRKGIGSPGEQNHGAIAIADTRRAPAGHQDSAAGIDKQVTLDAVVLSPYERVLHACEALVVVDHVVDGEPDDAAERLRVEQDDGGRDPGPQWQVAIVQDAAEQVDALVLRERRSLADHRGGQAEAPGEFAFRAPQQEGADGVAAVFA